MSLKLSSLLAGASLIVMATPAQAQQAAPQAADAPKDAEIIVTGSRVVKNGNASPSPVTVLSAQDLLSAHPGATLADTLNMIPAVSGSRNSTSNPTNVGAASGGNGAANTMNLRNLGANRTLVLMDGKRVPPTLFNGQVDVDIIPQMLIDRVDIVTGGVSAVYGSDAVSGVVNYIVNRKLQGFRAQGSYGISKYGDDGRVDVGVAWGTKIGQNGHFEASYEYRKENEVTSRASRPFLNSVGVTGAGTAASPYVLQTGLRQAQYPYGGLITSGALAGQYFASNGVLSPFVNGTATGTSGVQIGGSGGTYDSSLISGYEGHQFFGRFDYDVSPSTHAYLQVSGNIKTNTSDADATQLSNVTINRNNAFLPASVTAAIPTSQSTFTLSELATAIPRAHEDISSKQFIFVAGLDGKLGGWKWSADYTRGSALLNNNLSNVVNRQKLSAALDAVNSNGQIVCNASLTNAAYAGCVPYNPFGPTAASQAAINYVTDTVNYHALTTTDDANASLSGTLLDGWAGPINTAVSGEWRHIGFVSNSSSQPSQTANCTGLRYNCTASTQLDDFQFGATPTGLSQAVWEVAGELDVPLLRDVPFIKALSLNGAVRYTHYSTSGNYTTWKIGADWQVSNTLRFRFTRSRDIRAPTLYELYAPSNLTLVKATDTLTGQSPTVGQVTLANPNLTAEIGNTLTAGVVWKPTHNLSFAVDGYDIDITNAITQITGSATNLQNACYASGGSSPYCQLQVRPGGYTNTAASNTVTQWLIENINLSEVETWGVDFEGNYATHIANRPLQARLLVAWQPHIYYRQPNVATVDQGGVAFGPLGLYASPSVRVNGNITFKPTDRWTVSIEERWRNPMKLGGDPTQVWANNHMGAFGTTGINIAYDFKAGGVGYEAFFNMQNVFNAIPPLGAYSGNGTRAGLRDGFAIGDDIRGRYFTMGAKVRF